MIPTLDKDELVRTLQSEIEDLKKEFFRKCEDHLSEYKRVESLQNELNRLRDCFEAVYAQKSGVSVEFLRDRDQHVEPCYCGEIGCYGWKIVGPGVPGIEEEKS